MRRTTSKRDLFASLRNARRLLREHGRPCTVPARDFVRWLHTDTPYPNPSFEEIVRNPMFVVHELVEIEEVRRLGLRITKDVIVRNMERINDAHLEASWVEFAIAADLDRSHLRSRSRDLKAWCEDPLLTPDQRKRYEALARATRKRLRGLRGGRPRSGSSRSRGETSPSDRR